jgi:hypothetical protein
MQHVNSTLGPYYYFRLMGCGETGPLGDCDRINISEYLFDELTFFQPQPQELYFTDPREQRGYIVGLVCQESCGKPFCFQSECYCYVEWTAAVHTQPS